MNPGLVLTMALLAGSPPDADDEGLVRIRTTEPMVLAIIQEGQRCSPTFAALVERVERSDTFVYVVRTHTLPHGMEGCLVHESDSARRYLKVVLVMGTPSARMTTVLAHELQHVREVLDAGLPHDQMAMAALFKRIGVPRLGTNTGEQYETDAAQRIEGIVARDCGGRRRGRRKQCVQTASRHRRTRLETIHLHRKSDAVCASRLIPTESMEVYSKSLIGPDQVVIRDLRSVA